MFGPGLRNLDSPVAHIDGLLPHAIDLVAEDAAHTSRPARARKASSITAPSTCSTAYISYPSARNCARHSGGRRIMAPGHGHVRPPGPFCECRGRAAAAVMPHRAIRSTAKASPVRKKAPTFWAERTLSSTTVTGIFLHRGELFGRGPAEFFVGDFAHNGFGMVDFGIKSK